MGLGVCETLVQRFRDRWLPAGIQHRGGPRHLGGTPGCTTRLILLTLGKMSLLPAWKLLGCLRGSSEAAKCRGHVSASFQGCVLWEALGSLL